MAEVSEIEAGGEVRTIKDATARSGVAANTAAIEEINNKIPASASMSNKLISKSEMDAMFENKIIGSQTTATLKKSFDYFCTMFQSQSGSVNRIAPFTITGRWLALNYTFSAYIEGVLQEIFKVVGIDGDTVTIQTYTAFSSMAVFGIKRL